MNRICLAALLFCFCAAGAPCQAQTAFGFNPWFYGGYGFNTYTRDYVPYYAAHPPVYYSEPVARPYGYSPFAYPGFVATPQPAISHREERISRPQPEMIKNPFYHPAQGGHAEGQGSKTRTLGFAHLQTSEASTSAARSVKPGQDIFPARDYPGVRSK